MRRFFFRGDEGQVCVCGGRERERREISGRERGERRKCGIKNYWPPIESLPPVRVAPADDLALVRCSCEYRWEEIYERMEKFDVCAGRQVRTCLRNCLSDSLSICDRHVINSGRKRKV